MSAPLAPETAGLRRGFGALTVTDDVSLRPPVGARHALIGPNGAGKTTLVNLLTGVLRPSAGRILLGGEDVPGCRRTGAYAGASRARSRSISSSRR